MKKLHFTYDMQIDYSVEVSHCNFTIKCIPQNTLRQTIDNLKINISPAPHYQFGLDGLKNIQIWGANTNPHISFHFHIEGDAKTGHLPYEEEIDTDLAMVFAHPHGLNKAGNAIQNFYETKIKNIEASRYNKVIEIVKLLYMEYEYQAGVTSVDTTAEEAFRLGHGVCQDFSHILIALLHLSGITARYVTGFIIGEGKSHAWVEFLDNDKWYGVDPTHNKLVDDEYIKIAHGRDAKDCMINRGIMHGGGEHIQTINVSVFEV